LTVTSKTHSTLDTEHPTPARSAGALTPAQRRGLKARAHHLQPVVMIGDGGLTDQVEREIDANLRAHELIKIRVLGDDRPAREALIAAICEATGAQPVQHLGKIIVVYRPRPPEEEPKKKKARPRRKPPRRTKRSYQNT
jgi:putative YhbY family RNA-binding protein